MAITPVADNTPPVSATPESLTFPLDELLTGDTVVSVEGEMANLTVSSPEDGESSDKGASI